MKTRSAPPPPKKSPRKDRVVWENVRLWATDALDSRCETQYIIDIVKAATTLPSVCSYRRPRSATHPAPHCKIITRYVSPPTTQKPHTCFLPTPWLLLNNQCPNGDPASAKQLLCSGCEPDCKCGIAASSCLLTPPVYSRPGSNT